MIELSLRAIRAIRAIQKINIKFFVIGYSNIMCSTCGSIHPQVIKSSFRAIQKNFAFGYFNMMLIYFRLNVIAQILSRIIPYIKRAAQLRLSESKSTSY